jgi:hypothetical protein
LLSGNDLVMQVSSSAGWQNIAIGGLQALRSRPIQADFIDAVSGEASPAGNVAVSWDNDLMNLRFKVPEHMNGADNNPPRHLAYLVVRRVTQGVT